MFPSLTNRKISPHKNHGFALVIALSLMAFVLVLLLSITTLVQVESQSATITKSTMEARMNAQLGMQVAIGELQAALGPDARVSANASILDSDPSTTVIDGVEHTHWLGVYPTVNPSDVNGSLLTPKTLRDWSLGQVKWLVSEETGSNLDPYLALTNDAITLAQFIDDPTTDLPDLNEIEGLPSSALSKAEAELISIDGGAQANSSGRFAWWVGDESMKARVNTLASVSGADVLNGTEVNFAEQQKSNYQTTQGTNFSTWLPGYKDDLGSLDKVFAPTGLELLASSTGNTQWTNWSTLNWDKFTPYSQSLPVDVVNGQLKQDLTAYLKGDYNGLDGVAMIDDLFNVSAPREPSFDLLKQWSGMVSDLSVPQPVVAPDLQSGFIQHGLHPIITQGAVAMKHSYIEGITPRTFNPVYMFIPQIQLLNPHNVALEPQDYIVKIGYQFYWQFIMDKTRGSDKATFTGGNPLFRSWEAVNSQQPLPEHVLAANEDIQYQDNKRFFTFVIKDQAFEPGESLVFFAKPPPYDGSTPELAFGVEYNMNDDADTDILNNYDIDQEINLLWNEGSLEDSFFYAVSPSVGTLDASSSSNLGVSIKARSNFQSRKEGSGAATEGDVAMHLNLYVFQDDEPHLLHAITKPQQNNRYNNWYIPTFPLSRYQEEGNFDEYPAEYFKVRNPLINLGSSMLASNFDIFAGGSGHTPPKAGQPHAVLAYWNIRNQESFSKSDDWPSSLEATEWLNTFSFRDTPTFENTWQYSDNLYEHVSTDRLGGWWQSFVDSMAYPFFDYPTSPYGPISMGSFQHANLSVYGWQPTYAFGNAQAPPRFSRSITQDPTNEDLYDVSYLLNASTWDRYYLSTIPQDGATLSPGMRLPNSRQSLSLEMDDLGLTSAKIVDNTGFDLSAASVLIHGGFNVNSTSLTAWQAFLSGALGQSVETTYSGADSNSDTAAAMGRFLVPLLEEPTTVAIDRNSTDFNDANSWAATRTLNADEINTLATRIVEEVKRRGPFLSLADFVNRRLNPDTTVTGNERVYQEVLGTLQAAINKATLVDQKINYHYYDYDGEGGAVMTIKPVQDWSSTMNFDVSSEAQESMFGAPSSEIDNNGGLIHSYAPNALSQADVLTKIGPSITVRGDTFIIRSYGDSRNQFTNEVISEAWCEAVVQRVAEPIDWDDSDDQLIQTQALNNVSTPDFGRRFKLISFRWLTQQEVTPYSNDDAI